MQTAEFAGKPRIAFTGKRGKDQHLAMLSALAALFENGFSLDFVSLYSQMLYKFLMTDIPTYPFQRTQNYPTFVANRNNALGVGSPPVPAVPSIPQFIINQALCDFLDFHRIEGRRVLPGAAMIDFFARSTESNLLRSFQFHVPLVLDSPETQVHAEIDDKGFCQLFLHANERVKICSGFIGNKSAIYLPSTKELKIGPMRSMSKVEIYACFQNVQFGDIFRTLQHITFWDTHADGAVNIDRTNDLSHDRIRKLDACLHMFAAVSSQLAPPMDDTNGTYLPTSLEDFRLHSNDLPYDFVCRYYLPLEISRGGRSLSASFEVFSITGELLVSCKKYSVAWVPRGVVHKEQVKATYEKESWFHNGWTVRSLPTQSCSANKFDEVLYIGNDPSSRIIQALSSSVEKIILSQLSALPEISAQHPAIQNHSIASTMRGQDILVVVDLTEVNHFPGSVEFDALQIQVLELFKHLLENKVRISSFLALTSWCSPVDLRREGLCLFSDSNASARALIGAILQAVVRVFQRESGPHFDAWCLDLPIPDTLRQDCLNELIANEIHARQSSPHADGVVCYREDAQKQALCRLVPILQQFHHVPVSSPTGTTIIVGLGPIGANLATALIKAGVDHVVFLGRRSRENVHVGYS
jgi:hypothetical protein